MVEAQGGGGPHPPGLRHQSSNSSMADGGGGVIIGVVSSPATPSHKTASGRPGNSSSSSTGTVDHSHDHDDKLRKSTKKSLSHKDLNTSNSAHHHTSSHESVGHYNHHNHPNQSMSGINGLMMLLDGLGLAIIAAATILEGYESWKETFSTHWETNSASLSLWLIGRVSQIIGLMFLIGHAATFQIFPDIERFGMFLLTFGPIMNISSYWSFRHANIPNFLFNRQCLSNEALEIIGISILDISLIEMEEHFVLFAEITGFLTLCCAALLHFEYSEEVLHMPEISLRLDMIHCSECFGLIMLIIVAYGQYRMKVAKHEADKAHKHQASVTVV